MTKTHEILDRLVAFDTISARSNLPLIGYVEDFLMSRGFTITRIDSPCGAKAGLFAATGPNGQGVLLSAHTDVVPVEGQVWTRDPFSLVEDGGRLFGRGTTDMKGFLASMLSLADRASVASLKEPLKLSISYDEEVGCVGIAHMIGSLPSALGAPRACIVGEPTGMQVAIGHKGKFALRATFSGTEGHSALAPKFLNAIHPAADFVAELRNIQQEFEASGARDNAYEIPYTTFHVGRLNAGTALNIVPGNAVAEFEFRHVGGDDPDEIFTRIGKAAQSIRDRYAVAHPHAEITLERVNAYPGLDTPDDDGVVDWAQGLSGTSGTIKVSFGTEAGFFGGLGIPTVVCGPGSMEGQGHKPDEFIEAGQLAACDAMMDRLLVELTA